jgi:hypothetical protein
VEMGKFHKGFRAKGEFLKMGVMALPTPPQGSTSEDKTHSSSSNLSQRKDSQVLCL